jgi:diguanylate cyclase (GGDEF)-like protein
MIRTLLRRFGLWPAVMIVTLAATLASVLITASIYFFFLRIPLSANSLIVSVACPLVISPIITSLLFQFAIDLERAHERLREISNLDHLTNVFNRRYFMEKLRAEIERAQRYGSRFAVAFIDVDNFKHVNDRYGHLGGDEVLQRVAQACMTEVRKTDVFARLGGEEFSLLLPETESEAALQLLERLRLRVAALRVALPDGVVGVTVSIGHASSGGEAREVNAILREADEAMYGAKRGGKNQVFSHGAATSAHASVGA